LCCCLLLRQCFCHFCPVFLSPACPATHWPQATTFSHVLFGLSYQGTKDIVFRFTIEYSSLRGFYRPLGNSLVYFYVRIFWLVLKLEISYNNLRVIEL
jgi:hypothetical protein